MTEFHDPIDTLFLPIPPDMVKWKAGPLSGDESSTLAMAYIDARDAMERLDVAFGPPGWQDNYRVVALEPRAAVECSITAVWPVKDSDGNVRFMSVTKTDVGYPNGKNDEEPLKSAYSDAFKRCCVKFGIGRDLYETPKMWLPYNKQSKRVEALPSYVPGKGWVAPGERRQQAASSPAPRPASDAMRKKVFALATEKGKSKDELKAIGQAVTGKSSSTEWTTADVDKVISFLEELA